MTRAVTAVLRSAVVVIVAAFPATAGAGLRFDFTAEATHYSYAGRMAIEANRLRLDITSGNHPMFNPNVTIISRNAGSDVIVLEHARKSWFQRQVGHIAGPLPTVHGLGQATASNLRIEKSREPLTNAGGATERHTLRVEYDLDMDLDGEKMAAHVVIDGQFDIDPALPQRAHPWGLQFAAKTGFEKIDRAIELRIPDRLPLRQFVSASRQIDGGPVVTETLTIVVSNVTHEKIDDLEFHPPSSYPYQEPVFAFAQQ